MNPEDKDDDLLEQLRNESNESSDREVVEEIQPQTPQSTSTQTPTRDQTAESLSGVELPPNLLENAQVGLRDFIDNTFQGDQRSKDEIKTDRRNIAKQGVKKSEEFQKSIDEATLDTAPLTTIAREAVRAPLGGITGAVEGLVNTADLIGDTALTVFTDESEKNNVLGDKYEALNFDLGVAENKTAVGSFVREAISIYILMRRASVVPGLGGAEKTSAAGRLAVETARGAIADFITDGGTGNLSNLLEEINPNLSNTFWTALAHDEDDNPWERKLKNTIEGGFFGLGVDGVSEFLGATRAAKRVLNKKGYDVFFSTDPLNIKKADMDDAIDAALQHIRDNSTWYPTKDARLISQVNLLKDGETLDNLNRGFKANLQTEIRQAVPATDNIPREVNDLFDPALRAIDKAEKLQKQISVDAQINEWGEALKSTYTPNGAQIDWNFTDVTKNATPGAKTLEVMFDINKEQTNLRNIRKTFKFFVNSVKYDGKFQKALEKVDIMGRYAKGNITNDVWQKLDMEERMVLIEDAIDYGNQYRSIYPTDFQDAYKKIENLLNEYDAAIGNNLGGHIFKVFPQFNEIIKDLEPGTILKNTPDRDGGFGRLSGKQSRISLSEAGRGNVRKTIYKRAGFGPQQNDQYMYAVVKRDKSGKNILRPIDDTFTREAGLPGRGKLDKILEQASIDERVDLDPKKYYLSANSAAIELELITNGYNRRESAQHYIDFFNKLTPSEISNWLESTTKSNQSSIRPYLPTQYQLIKWGNIKLISEVGDARIEWLMYPDDEDLLTTIGNTELSSLGPKVYQVVWKPTQPGMKLNLSGTRVITKFNELAADSFEPGTILSNSPASDGLSEASMAQRRANNKAQIESDKKWIEDNKEGWLDEAERGAFGDVLEGWPIKWQILDEFGDTAKTVEVTSWEDLWNKMPDIQRKKDLEELARQDLINPRPQDVEKGGGVRARIYERAGFTKMDSFFGMQFAMVKSVPDSRGRIFEPLEIEFDEYGEVKEFGESLVDQYKRNTTPPEQLYEPHERAGRTKDGNPQEAAKSQAQIEDFDNVSQVASTPLLSDAAYASITTRALQNATKAQVDELKEIIGEVGSQIDVEELSRSLGQSDLETVSKALVGIRKFLGASNETPENALKLYENELTFTTNVKGEEFKVLSREGVVATKTLITDTALQIQNLAEVSEDLILHRLDTARQSEHLVTRLQGLLRLHKVSAVHYGSGLRSFQVGPLKGFAEDLSKNLAGIDNSLNKMKELLRKGDAQAIADYKDMVRGLVLADGDPLKQLSFNALAQQVGWREALKSMYNSMLSGPVTQARNIIGSAMTSTLRPLAMATGYTLQGNKEMARISMGAFHSYQESMSEAFMIFKKSWNEKKPINEGEKFAARTAETKKQLDRLDAAAKTDQERDTANFLRKVHNFLDSPWLTYPTRTMTATDDAFKTLVSRMELKREAMEQTFKQTDKGFEVDEDIYAKLIDQKIGINGEIINQKLLSTAKEITFQQDLEGWMAKFAGVLEENPVFKYFVPFVKTPHNILVYSGTYVPGLNRFLKEVQDIRNAPNPDPNELAILAGREAIGTLAAGVGVTWALTGNLTGNGPSDPDQFKIWRQYNQPQSIRIGNRWVSYASIEPLNVIFAAAADIPILLRRGYYEGAQAAIGQLTWTIAQATTNRSYFEGLSAALAFLNPTELTKGENLSRQGWQAINTMIPLSGARRQLSKALTPGLIEYRNQFDRTMSQGLPGYNLFTNNRVDIFDGEPIENQTSPWSMNGLDIATGVMNNVLPFNISRRADDPVIKKLNEYGVGIHSGGEFGKTIDGIELTAKDKGQLNGYIAEYGLHKNLKRLFNDPDFIRAKKAWDKAKWQFKAGPAEESQWYKMITKEFSDAKKWAKNEFKRNNTLFNRKLTERKTQLYNRANSIYR